MNADQRLVVIGGGPAALAAVRAYRQGGGEARVEMFSTESRPPYFRPALTKEYLRDEQVADELPMEAGSWYRENGVELHLRTPVEALEPGELRVRAGGREITYDACLLATGSEPVRPPFAGTGESGILTLREVEDADRLKGLLSAGERAVVVGSGFIGCEAAASLATTGVEVTLVSQEETPQRERLGPEAGERIRRWLTSLGVELRLGTQVQSIEPGGEGYTVALAGEEAIGANAVLLGTGVRPRTDLARQAGIEVAEGGILTDERFQTSAEGVFAAGDCALATNAAAGRRLYVEHWNEAETQGGVFGSALAGGDAAWNTVPNFWSEIGPHSLEYSAWGDGWDEARFAERGGEAFAVYYGRDGTCVGVLTYQADDDLERGRSLVENGEPLPAV